MDIYENFKAMVAEYPTTSVIVAAVAGWFIG